MKTHRMTYHTHTANWRYNNGNLWDLRVYYEPKLIKSQIFIQIITPPNLAVAPAKADGAGEGNRTLVFSLGS